MCSMFLWKLEMEDRDFEGELSVLTGILCS